MEAAVFLRKEIISLLLDESTNESDKEAYMVMYSQDHYTEEVLREILARLRDQKAMNR